MQDTLPTLAPATTIMPAIAAHIAADPFNADQFLGVAVRLLRQRQLERRASGKWPDDSQATLIQIWKQVADEWAIEAGVKVEGSDDD